jgi:hypothetical protein
MPDFNYGMDDWIASRHVDDLGIKELHTFLRFGDVVAQILARYVIRTLGDLKERMQELLPEKMIDSSIALV